MSEFDDQPTEDTGATDEAPPEPAEEPEDDTDLTDQDANAVPSADEPDDLDGTAEATHEGLEHDPANPETESE